MSSVYLAGYGVFAGVTQQGQRLFEPIVAGNASAMLTLPAAAPLTYGYAQLIHDGELGPQQIFEAGGSPLTLAPPLLPWLGELVVNTSIGRAIWLQTTGSHDGAWLQATWSRFFPDESTHFYAWTVVVPPGVTDLDFGAPPAELQPFLPGATDTVATTIELVHLPGVTDYDALRALPEWQIVHGDAAVAAGDVSRVEFATAFVPGSPGPN